MSSNTFLVVRSSSEAQWLKTPGDREISSGRPSIPAAWLALFDPKDVRRLKAKIPDDPSLVGKRKSEVSFVGLVTEREAALQRLATRRANLLAVFGADLEPHLARFETVLRSATEPYLQVLLYDTYIDWTKANILAHAKKLVSATDGTDPRAWRIVLDHFDGERSFGRPGLLVGALVGWITGESVPDNLEFPDDARARIAASGRALFASEAHDRAALRATAIDAMRAGVVHAELFRFDLGDEDDALFARATLMDVPDDVSSEPLSSAERDLLKRAPLRRDAEVALLSDPKTREPHYYLDHLIPPLFRLMRAALVARTDALPADRFAREVMNLLALLGGDNQIGVLTVISGREEDDDGSFGRALAFAHACGIWSVATLEATTTQPADMASSAPLLVLARFRTRLRQRWNAAVDLAAYERRFPALSSTPPETLAAVSARADAMCDWLAICEAPDAILPTTAMTLPGLVVQKRRGLTLAFASAGPQTTVAAFAHPEKPYPRVASSFLTPITPPASLGKIILGTPRDLA